VSRKNYQWFLLKECKVLPSQADCEGRTGVLREYPKERDFWDIRDRGNPEKKDDRWCGRAQVKWKMWVWMLPVKAASHGILLPLVADLQL
jgi:hypothetical protein